MTEPTDAEILDAADDFSSQYMHGGITFDEFDSIGFARAVLAKWGTPAPVGVETITPFISAQRERLFYNRPENIGKGLAMADWHRVVQYVEAAHGIGIKGGQHGTDN